MKQGEGSYREWKLFIALSVAGVAAALLHVHIPHTHVLIDGRWAFGFMGFALLRRWWAALGLGALLSYPFGTPDIPLWIGFWGNMLYAVPSLLASRPLADWMQRQWGPGWRFGMGWGMLILLCYQVFITPAVWGVVTLMEGRPAGAGLMDGWRTQPFLVESVLVALFSGASMTAALSINRLRDQRRRLEHLNSVLLGIRNVNQLIVTEGDPERLIERACVNLSETMGYQNAWIALLGGEASRALGLPDEVPISAAAARGIDRGFETMSEQLERGRFPDCMRQALEHDTLIVVNDPPAECSNCPLACDYAGRAGFTRRLTFEGRTYGILTASVPAAYARDAEEQDLFNEVAGDLAFALHKIAAARRLEETYDRFRSVFEAANAGQSLTLPSGELNANKAFAKMLGYTPGELRGKTWQELTPPEDVPETECRIAPLLDGREDSTRFEKRYVRKDGGTVWGDVSVAMQRDTQGRPQHFITTVVDITQRKQAEESARESTMRLKEAIRAANVGLWDWDLIRDSVYYSREWKEQVGHTEDEIQGSLAEWRDRVHPDDLPSTLAQIEKAIAGTTQSYHVEFRFRHKDGSYRWILAQSSILRDETGRAVRVLGSHIDLTEQKAREERESLLGSMLDNAPASITIHNTEGRFLFANAATGSLHGYANLNEFLQLNLHDLDVPECETLMAERVQKIMEEGEAHFEVMHHRKDGSTFPLDVLATRINWEGRPAILSIATDLTERKRAEMALKASEIRFKELLLNVPTTAVQGYAMDGTVQYWNRASEIFYGYTAQEAIGQNLLDLIIPPDMRGGASAAIRRMVETRETIPASEMELMRKDGSLIPVYSSHALVQLPGQEPELFCIDIDLTEIKRAETEREKLNAQLMQAQKMEAVGRLAGGVAHDFNNILQATMGYSEMLVDSLPDDAEEHEFATEISTALERAATLTRQLLSFARKQTVAPKVLNLDQTIESMLRMLRRLIGEDINLVWHPHGSLWSVIMDPGQVDQILVNLCVNARDAIGGVGNVIIKTENVAFDEAYCAVHAGFAPGEFVMLSVSDDGAGMDKETLDNIFEPFFTTKSLGEGTGLGMATVYGIVKQNQGLIAVDSEPGRGTTIRIYLPCHAAEPALRASLAETTAYEGHGETVLFVEDDASILRIGKQKLMSMKYHVHAFAGARDAVEFARVNASKVDLLITDVVMPEMGGRDLAEAIRSFNPDIRVLYMSGYTADVISNRGVLDQGVNFIQKPFSLRDLTRKVSEALDSP